MASVAELQPGDLVTLGDMSAVFIVSTRHADWPALALVIWRLSDGTLSFDALAPGQDVGDVTAATPGQRQGRLIDAIRGGTREAIVGEH